MGGWRLHEDTSARDRSVGTLFDAVGRRIDHLRLSVTPACDLRCPYCRPPGTDRAAEGRPLMTNRQRIDLVSWLVDEHGLSKVRITGGEPLLAPGLVDLVAALRDRYPELTMVLTTNAVRLPALASALRSAGLERINFSLDSLRPDRFAALTGGELPQVLAGLEAARAAGFADFKVNVVALKGVNDDEFGDLVAWSCREGIEVRFLEAMPIGPAAEYNRRHFISGAEMRRIVGESFELRPLPHEFGLTARRYAVAGRGLTGVCGLITPVTEPFCGDCRRVRVTADGRLFPCLLDSRSFDLMTAWRNGPLDRRTAEQLLGAGVGGKAESGSLQKTAMAALGG